MLVLWSHTREKIVLKIEPYYIQYIWYDWPYAPDATMWRFYSVLQNSAISSKVEDFFNTIFICI